MQVKQTQVFEAEEVQIHGGRDGDSFGNWWWAPSHRLPDVQPGKKLVVLHPCNCGCWSEDSTQRARELVRGRSDPLFALRAIDDRYIVQEDHAGRWLIIDR